MKYFFVLSNTGQCLREAFAESYKIQVRLISRWEPQNCGQPNVFLSSNIFPEFEESELPIAVGESVRRPNGSPKLKRPKNFVHIKTSFTRNGLGRCLASPISKLNYNRARMGDIPIPIQKKYSCRKSESTSLFLEHENLKAMLTT